MKRSLFAAALVSLTVFGASAQDQPKRPEAALGEAFCLVKDNPEAAGPLLLVTTALAAEIRAAMAKNAEIQKAHPDEKPPLGDGVPFQSYQDVSPRCEVGTVEGEGIGAVEDVMNETLVDFFVSKTLNLLHSFTESHYGCHTMLKNYLPLLLIASLAQALPAQTVKHQRWELGLQAGAAQGQTDSTQGQGRWRPKTTGPVLQKGLPRRPPCVRDFAGRA